MAKKKLKFIQLITGTWSGECGETYTVIGLTATGEVYRYVHSLGGWQAYVMVEVAG